jgi:transposase-like protein
MKSLLDTRPIYHKCDETIRRHVFCSFLALLLRKELEARLAHKEWKLEWADVIRDLNNLIEMEVAISGKSYVFRGHPPGVAGKVFQAYLEQLRWKAGFRCPRCEGDKGWRLADGRWSCAGCSRRISVTAGTIFDRSRIPLQDWFTAAWYMTNQKHGLSALGLQQLLGLGSYQTAWTMLHKLRTAMVRPGRERLHGPVEVDETYVGGIEEGGPRTRYERQIHRWDRH